MQALDLESSVEIGATKKIRIEIDKENGNMATQSQRWNKRRTLWRSTQCMSKKRTIEDPTTSKKLKDSVSYAINRDI